MANDSFKQEINELNQQNQRDCPDINTTGNISEQHGEAKGDAKVSANFKVMGKKLTKEGLAEAGANGQANGSIQQLKTNTTLGEGGAQCDPSVVSDRQKTVRELEAQRNDKLKECVSQQEKFNKYDALLTEAGTDELTVEEGLITDTEVKRQGNVIQKNDEHLGFIETDGEMIMDPAKDPNCKEMLELSQKDQDNELLALLDNEKSTLQAMGVWAEEDNTTNSKEKSTTLNTQNDTDIDITQSSLG